MEKVKVAVIGAGPAGFYTAQALLDANEIFWVDIFDTLPFPYGLVRYGVAPDHQKIKAVAKVFAKTGRNKRVRFFGNVGYPDLIDLDLLKECYDFLFFTVGAQADRKLNIPGEELKGSVSSTEFVYWYNGHPFFCQRKYNLQSRNVIVVGIGNVAMDVARLLAKNYDQLNSTDMADYALEEWKRNEIENIYVIARRGPAQAKCSAPELKELGKIEGVQVVVSPSELQLDENSLRELENSSSARKVYETLKQFATDNIDPSKRHIFIKFLLSPREILGNGKVEKVRFEKNRLVNKDGYLAAEGTAVFEEINASMVIKAIGYRSFPLEGLPFDEKAAIIPNESGAVVGIEGDLAGRVYVAGWVKRGPRGLIGSNKKDAQQSVNKLVENLTSFSLPFRKRECDIKEYLSQRNVDYIDFPTWLKIDKLEEERGKKLGKPRVKFLDLQEALKALEKD